MFSRMIRAGLLLALAVLLIPSFARAGSFTFQTPPGATDTAGDPVSATATFLVSAGQIVITLTNTLPGEKDVGQAITDLGFFISTGQTTGTLSTSSGLERTVAKAQTFTDGSTVATGWLLQTGSGAFSGGLRLCDLCAPIGPAHTIIGPATGSTYPNANGSIAGNGPHNPFLAGDVSYTITIAGLSNTATITSAIFSFGTTEGDNITGGTSSNKIPEPSTLLLFGSGLLFLSGVARRYYGKRK